MLTNTEPLVSVEVEVNTCLLARWLVLRRFSQYYMSPLLRDDGVWEGLSPGNASALTKLLLQVGWLDFLLPKGPGGCCLAASGQEMLPVLFHQF